MHQSPCPARLLRRLLAAMLPCLSLASPPARGDAPPARAYPALNLVLAVDVSDSMVIGDKNKAAPPNDKEGMRWDGLQFAIDVAGKDDRIALVLFRASAAVITKAIDPSGLVELDRAYPEFGGKTGRTLLKSVVGELQEIEQEGKVVTYALRSLQDDAARRRGDPPRAIAMWQGTSIIRALAAIEGLDLRPGPVGRVARVFLFTDGDEQKPDRRLDPDAELGLYDYVGEVMPRQTSDPAGFRRWVGQQVQGFRAGGVPVFTFGIGKACNFELLRLVAEQTRPDARADGRDERFVGYYAADTNVDVLKDLRWAIWELNHYWSAALGNEPFAGRVRFATETDRALSELGVLLFRHATVPVVEPGGRAGSKSMILRPGHLPEVKVVRPGARAIVETPLAGVEPRPSRSHLFLDLGGRPELGLGDARLVVEMPPSDARSDRLECIVASRTSSELFAYALPDGRTAYSPKDAIPFQVDFTPVVEADGRVPFRPDHFRVEMTLIPAEARAAPPTPTLKLTLDPESVAVAGDGGALDRRPWRFAKTVVLDQDPNSTGAAFPAGSYVVETRITATGGPLRGAVRRMNRQSITIGPYPRLTAGADRVVLSNLDRSPTGTGVSVALDLLEPGPTIPLASLKVEVLAGPRSPGGRAIEPGAFRVEPRPLILSGKGEALRVSLAADRWSSLPTGEYEGGKLRITAPWSTAPLEVGLAVGKSKYRVHAEPVLVPLGSGSKRRDPIRRPVRARLETGLRVQETASIGATRAGGPAPRGRRHLPADGGRRPDHPEGRGAREVGRALALDGDDGDGDGDGDDRPGVDRPSAGRASHRHV